MKAKLWWAVPVAAMVAAVWWGVPRHAYPVAVTTSPAAPPAG